MKQKQTWVRRVLQTAAVFSIAASTALYSFAMPAKAAEANLVQAPAAMLIDLKSGQVLYAKNENEKRYPASTTKIMDLLLIMEAVQKGEKKLTDIVPVPLEAYNVEGSSVWLDPKEKWTLDDMIKFISVPSGNDAAVATAVFIGGSQQAFVKMMNDKAQQLGMKNTHFANPDGLHDPNHYTTASDLAIVAKQLVTEFPQIYKYTSIQKFEIRNGKNVIENTNHLIGKYEGMNGLKTGFTDEAGNCLVSTVDRNGYQLMGIILGAKDDQERQLDTIKLLDFGYNNFTSQLVAGKDKPLPDKALIKTAVNEQVEVAPAKDFYLTIRKGQDQGIETKYVWNNVEAPLKKGQVVGQMQKVQNGQVLNSVDLVVTQDVERGSWFRLLFRNLWTSIKGLI
ncbi:D-alanyl-D-alanine carboxypeptidase family protein [Effusibacillus dendaii]|uniref:serine-type D-Ala-D-Ala carboxypeptidase n=1 Tax=Effusibacillus dendaii TaxID=2743772 RepID=A0A7I8DFW5_9BACL|nr:D-alanyl-D-alanine carboxypeptidase family protein [Effusibacillus dendaii]BCJ87460.1 D-alanyl-D-alanine carboxypeptidase [Effusibacillus dendaii]